MQPARERGLRGRGFLLPNPRHLAAPLVAILLALGALAAGAEGLPEAGAVVAVEGAPPPALDRASEPKSPRGSARDTDAGRRIRRQHARLAVTLLALWGGLLVLGLRGNRAVPRVVAAVCLAGAALSAGRLHGFSLPAWYACLDDDSPMKEVLIGRPQKSRADDYIAVLPQILAQLAHRPPFPVENTLIGDGRCNMRINYAVPVRHVETLFRPHLWGYFAGADFGLAFHWWFIGCGAWIVLFLALRRFCPADPVTAAAGATALVFSPFFQYWALNCGPSVLYGMGTFLAGTRVLESRTRRGVLGGALLLAACLIAFLLTFSFGRYLVTLGWLVAALLGGYAWDRRPRCGRADGLSGLRLAAAAGALAAVGAAVWSFRHANADALRTAMRTLYPALLEFDGGGGTWSGLMRGLFTTADAPRDWGIWMCHSAGGGFLFTYPLVGAALALDVLARRRRGSASALALLLFLLVATVWYLAGLPSWLARVFLLNHVPEERAMLAMGVADMLLVILYVTQRPEPFPEARRRRGVPRLLLWAAWLILLAGVGCDLHGLLPRWDVRNLVWNGLLAAGLAAALLARPRLFLPALATLSVAGTLWFNPLVRGGTRYLRENPVSREVLELDAAYRADRNCGTRWVAYGDGFADQLALGNLFRMIGVYAVNGCHPYPQLGVWKTLDPDGAYAGVWNRYAHVFFALPGDPQQPFMTVPSGDSVRVHLHPADPRFAALNLQYVLYRGRHPERFTDAGLEAVRSFGKVHIFRVPTGGAGRVESAVPRKEEPRPPDQLR